MRLVIAYIQPEKLNDVKRALYAAEIYTMSDALVETFGDAAIDLALTGGDDYELCFTADPAEVANIDGITAIGSITAGSDLVCRRDGQIVEVDDRGYRHFA